MPSGLNIFSLRYSSRDVSDAISRQIDEQVRNMVKQCYLETVKIISNHREAIDKLVEVLIEKETIDGEEFSSIVKDFASIPDKERTIPVLNN